jgi:predicted lipoprotein with Yx(FWY)xxD motif
MVSTMELPRPMYAGLRLAVSLLLAFVLIGGLSGGLARAQEQPTPTVVLMPAGPAGTVLTDPAGWTLYTWDGDQEGMSNCFDACLLAWPAFVIDADLIAPDGLPGSLGLISRDDGTWQVTLDNWPLYYFSGDAAPGAANGDGSMGFGARWYVTAFAAPAQAAPVQPVVSAPPVAPVPQAPVAVAPPPPAPVLMAPPQAPTVARASVPVNIVGASPMGQGPTIQVGDTVVWTNNSPSVQTVTSDTGAFDSGRLNPGQTYSFTFNAPGLYGYHSAANPGIRSAIAVGAGASDSQYSTNPYSQGPFFGSPSMPGYDPSYNQYMPGYDGYSSQNPYGGYAGQNPSGGQPAFPGQGYPTAGYTQTLNIVAPPNGIVAINWLPTPNVTSYRIYNTLASAPMNFSVAQTVNQTTGGMATNAILTGLAPGASYLIQVRAVSPSGLEMVAPAASSSQPGYGQPGYGQPGYGLPGYGPQGFLTPTSLSVSGMSATTATLAWTGNTGATSYRVSQATNAAGPFTPSVLTAVTGTGSTVTGLAPSTTYFFQVVAMDAQGNQGVASNTANGLTTP